MFESMRSRSCVRLQQPCHIVLSLRMCWLWTSTYSYTCSAEAFGFRFALHHNTVISYMFVYRYTFFHLQIYMDGHKQTQFDKEKPGEPQQELYVQWSINVDIARITFGLWFLCGCRKRIHMHMHIQAQYSSVWEYSEHCFRASWYRINDGIFFDVSCCCCNMAIAARWAHRTNIPIYTF